jgi:hypothetical protein
MAMSYRHLIAQLMSSVTALCNPDSPFAESAPRTMEECEVIAEKFRADLELSADQRLDSLRIEADGATVIPLGKATGFDSRTKMHRAMRLGENGPQ